MANRRQEQIDPFDAVVGEIRAAIRRHPTPLRPVDKVRLTLSMYCGKVLRILLLESVIVAGFVITFYQSGGSGTIWALRIFFAGAFVLFLFGPGRNTFTVARWVREGLPARADVSEAHLGSGEWKRPAARGRRVVHHPVLGDFHDEFAIVSPWAGSVTSGSELIVLVAPNRRESWLTLGLEGAPGTPAGTASSVERSDERPINGAAPRP
jgi:hypothetical protein